MSEKEKNPMSQIPPINKSDYAKKINHSSELKEPMPYGAPINNDPERYEPNPRSKSSNDLDFGDQPISMTPPINKSGYVEKVDHTDEPKEPMPYGAPINNDPEKYEPKPRDKSSKGLDFGEQPLSMIPPINKSEYTEKIDHSDEPEDPMPYGVPINNASKKKETNK